MIELLYPDVANLYGDLANVEYLTRCAPQLTIHTTRATAAPLFLDETPDLVFLGGMTESGQELVLDRLRPHRARLAQLIDDGVPFLVTSNALELFGDRIETPGQPAIEGLGLFGSWAKRDLAHRHNSLYLGRMAELGDDPIVGFRAQFTWSYGPTGAAALFETVRGQGLGPDLPDEGIRRNNFMATYLLGPICLTNPAFARYLLGLIGVEDPELAYDQPIWQSYHARLAEFETNHAF